MIDMNRDYLRNPNRIMRNPRTVKPIARLTLIWWNLRSTDLRNSLSSESRCITWLNRVLRIRGIACSSESVPVDAMSPSASLIFLSRNFMSISCVVSSKIFIVCLQDKEYYNDSNLSSCFFLSAEIEPGRLDQERKGRKEWKPCI